MPEKCQSDIAGTFVMLPVELLLSDRCSPVALKLYSVLLMYCRKGDTAWPGQPQLAADMKVSERHIRTILDELEKCGLITREPRAGTSTMYHVYKYTLLEAVAPALAPTLETEVRIQTSAPPRNNRSHELKKFESNKNYKRYNVLEKKPVDPVERYVKSVGVASETGSGDVFAGLRGNLVRELGQQAATSLLEKGRYCQVKL